MSKPFFLWRHLNKLRWVTLTAVFAILVTLPFLHVYQTYVAAHAYDLLAPSEQRLYDVMEWLTAPFTEDAAEDLDAVKGNTWCKYLDYSKYLACIEEINFEIKRRFEDEGIEMAYPTQTVHLLNKEASRA